jgi:pimeloyl-ACP methyl ester carboxylesterase
MTAFMSMQDQAVPGGRGPTSSTCKGCWADDFDWRAQERQLDALKHFRAELGGIQVHFVHERAQEGNGIPLIRTQGWPSSFLELLPLVPLLTNPKANGIDGTAFDLVIASLPGYGFPERPAHTDCRTVARMWQELMHGLGYERYGAGGGDSGAGVATHMAIENPAPMIGIHLTTMELRPPAGEGTRPSTEAESAHAAQVRQWDEVERGFSSIQSTRPQTLGYALNDSPAGLAAWLLEKWRAWSDSETGGMARRFHPAIECRYPWALPTSTTTMCQREALCGNGRSGSTTFVGGPRCRAAGTVLARRSLSALRAISQPSSRRSDSARRGPMAPGNDRLTSTSS